VNDLAGRFTELAGIDIPLPGKGETRQRWRFLSDVAAEDLALTKLVESHFDAVAILHEVGAQGLLAPGQRWAVWAAEPPTARVSVTDDGVVTGTKAWCSGADLVSHGLITAWNDRDQPQLVAFELSQSGIRPIDGAWQAIGMGRVHTPDLALDHVSGELVGSAEQYLRRPGFWHGGAGIAACWYGGILPLARAVGQRKPGSYRDAHLGAIDIALRSLRSLLIETATRIDRSPEADVMLDALRVRSAADQTARLVLDHAGRALGAGPLCRDRQVAEHFADLPVFIRQTHAEQDLAALAAELDEELWQL